MNPSITGYLVRSKQAQIRRVRMGLNTGEAEERGGGDWPLDGSMRHFETTRQPGASAGYWVPSRSWPLGGRRWRHSFAGVTDGRVGLGPDCSLAIALEDLLGRAKELATRTAALLEGHRDTRLIAYSEVARVVTDEELAGLSWDYVYGSKLHHALMLA